MHLSFLSTLKIVVISRQKSTVFGAKHAVWFVKDFQTKKVENIWRASLDYRLAVIYNELQLLVIKDAMAHNILCI